MSMIEPIDPHGVYTPAEAARLLRLSTSTVLRLARTGRIKPVRIGKMIRSFLGSELLAFLQGGGTDEPALRHVPDQVRRRTRVVA